ncbi:hypothetical protein ACU4GD_37085 [Cupriavidus basilensis]
MVHDVKAPAPLYAKVAAALDGQMMVELLATIGFYMLVSRLLENLEVDIENPPWKNWSCAMTESWKAVRTSNCLHLRLASRAATAGSPGAASWW